MNAETIFGTCTCKALKYGGGGANAPYTSLTCECNRDRYM